MILWVEGFESDAFILKPDAQYPVNETVKYGNGAELVRFLGRKFFGGIRNAEVSEGRGGNELRMGTPRIFLSLVEEAPDYRSRRTTISIASAFSCWWARTLAGTETTSSRPET